MLCPRHGVPNARLSPDSKVVCPDYRPSGSRHVDSSELDQALVQIVRTAVCRSGRLRQSDRPIGHWRCESEWPWCLGRKGACLAPPGWFRKIDLGLRANDDGSLSIPRYADHVPAPMGPDRHGISVPFDWRPLKRSGTNNTPHRWSFGVASRMASQSRSVPLAFCKWGWSLPNISAASSCDRACTIE
jgi:hypothetical protein